MVGLGKTLVKEKRLFYYNKNLHKIFYTTAIFIGLVTPSYNLSKDEYVGK
jgi:hypothetical protein